VLRLSHGPPRLNTLNRAWAVFSVAVDFSPSLTPHSPRRRACAKHCLFGKADP